MILKRHMITFNGTGRCLRPTFGKTDIIVRPSVSRRCVIVSTIAFSENGSRAIVAVFGAMGRVGRISKQK